jgi:hypothetical protein
MKQYEVTAKLWVKFTGDTQEQAERVVKTIIDEALIEYMQNHTPGEDIRISKSKVTWVKNTQKEEYE